MASLIDKYSIYPKTLKTSKTHSAGSWWFGGSRNQPQATIIAEMALII